MGKDLYVRKDISISTKTLGNRHACWTFIPTLLNQSSIVYSFGVGRDISFDLHLINMFHLHVFAFDPTPSSIEWIKNENGRLPDEFHFYDFGIASIDGNISFYPPEYKNYGSYSIIKDVYQSSSVMLPVKRLTSIMQELHHNHIDLLKMDVEGAEYAVIEDMVKSNIFPRQLLIEFHHRFKNIGVQKTKEIIHLLKQNEYHIFHVSPTGAEISFLRLDHA
ncbi:MAG: FkbM family methyltransferase [Thermoflavifilum sp.]|uniref:FkbM family methyltransferase n=1 Tax=Thermoflavifilum sp. TaxID=1968839 RepID=UPI0018A36048|nr:FkbM family methyltransferase [Thermoflavifilum sp.]QOR75575.1 MAG: FkbM family methyltransferase [Thermoflavifilum sp.]